MSNLQAAIAALKNNNNQTASTSSPTNPYQPNPTVSPTRANMLKIQASIKAERNNQGLTQRELAYKAGMSQGTITRAERNGWVSITCILRIANALGKELILN